MSDSRVSLSLDDIIKKDKIGGKGGRSGSYKSGSGGRDRRSDRDRRNSGGRAGNRDFGNRGNNRGRVQKRFQRNDNFNRRRSPSPELWEHDKYRGPTPNGRPAEYGVRSTAKLLISNLDFGVVDQDLKELFGQFGPMTECRVLYERSGRSTGTAEVHFQRTADAKRARQEYNNVPLDGRDMNIVFMGGR